MNQPDLLYKRLGKDKRGTRERYPFALYGYCLMSNHFHLLLKPMPGQSISRILQSLTVAHTWRHHRRCGTSGHVWQGRFRSPVIQDGDHLLIVLRYIEANPLRAGMVTDPCEYPWSSHRCHGAGHADPLLGPFPEWETLGRTEPERRARWRRKVRVGQSAGEARRRESVPAHRPTFWRRGLGRGHFPTPRHPSPAPPSRPTAPRKDELTPTFPGRGHFPTPRHPSPAPPSRPTAPRKDELTPTFPRSTSWAGSPTAGSTSP